MTTEIVRKVTDMSIGCKQCIRSLHGSPDPRSHIGWYIMQNDEDFLGKEIDTHA